MAKNKKTNVVKVKEHTCEHPRCKDTYAIGDKTWKTAVATRCARGIAFVMYGAIVVFIYAFIIDVAIKVLPGIAHYIVNQGQMTMKFAQLNPQEVGLMYIMVPLWFFALFSALCVTFIYYRFARWGYIVIYHGVWHKLTRGFVKLLTRKSTDKDEK